jgi:hypothetical protein
VILPGETASYGSKQRASAAVEEKLARFAAGYFQCEVAIGIRPVLVAFLLILIEVLEDVGMHTLTRRNSLAEYEKKVTVVLLIFLIPIFASVQSKPKHLVTFDDLGQTAMTESLQLSPDGHMLA